MARNRKLVVAVVLALSGWVSSLIAGPLADGAAAAHNGDFLLARQMFTPLAQEGNATAQFNLGYLYANGWGVERDDAEAIKLFRKAAERGLPIAQYYLGLAFQFGDGVQPDQVEAVKWFRRAAEQGFHRAQLALGLAYAAAQAVELDPVQAFMWVTLAKQGPDVVGAEQARYSFSRWMRVDQIREAQELLRHWKPTPEPNRTAFPEVGELIATDHAGELADPTAWPVEVVGRLNIQFSPHHAGFCTGALVGPKLVLTAAHCLFNRGELVPPESVVFLAGVSRGTAQYSSVAERLIPSDEVTPRLSFKEISLLPGDSAPDWAVIVLKKEIPIKPISVRSLSSDEMRAVSKNGTAFQIGYGKERPFSPSIARNCRLYPPDVGNRVFLSRCLSNPGYSGSPVLAEIDGITSLVGVFSQGASLLYGFACSASQFEKRISELNAEGRTPNQ